MTGFVKVSFVFGVVQVLIATTAAADPPADGDKSAAVDAAPDTQAATTPSGLDRRVPPVTPTETSLEECRDGIDNDGNGLVDCADTACQIYAICVQPTPTVPVPIIVSAPVETGSACKDQIDNDGNGLIDCQEPLCQPTKYCRKEMFERPTPINKPQGFVISAHVGAALPNYNWKDVRGDSVYGENIPFDPDTGWSMGLKLLAVPVRWFGVGLNLRGGFTYASNRQDYISVADDDSEYKYDGIKTFGHLGGIIRLQAPVRRVVPYVDIAFGYSAARYHWYTYNGRYAWEEIGDWWDEDSTVAAAEVYRQNGHFTLALEPGIDVFVVERRFAIGGSVWLPIYANEYSSMDNIGILLNFTFTPAWPEPAQLKQQYAPYVKQ